MDILPDPGWERLLGRLLTKRETVVLVGATDSGKTTLARYLIESLVKKRRRAALIDSDIGQSGIGLPGSICMKVFRRSGDLRDFGFERMSFLGYTNPSKVIPLMVTVTRRMTAIGRRRAGIVVVDTTGLVSGELGRALKIAKIRAINPTHVVALQREDELEHLLSLIEGVRIIRLKASAWARTRSSSSRRVYRRTKLQEYFSARKQFEGILDVKALDLFFRGRTFHLGEKEIPHRAIVGLNCGDDTVALGIIEGVEGTSLFLRSPLKSLRGINRVVCGDMTMS